MNSTYYVVLCSHKRGAYIAETDKPTHVGTLIADICNGQYGTILHVFEFDPVKGTSADCTSDIANDCRAFLAQENREPTHILRDFIEAHTPALAA